ncbi:hypothetical protein JXA31_00280 [Candidatus Bathyarchaeota archaeon]|nr:hypothetical protein [Candidatus Bathyarchaeota archaeon]
MFATKKLAAAFIFALVFSAVAGLADFAAANPGSDTLPVLVMPEEYVNYTITCVNGTLWAKIDGTYPLRILTESDGVSSCVLAELPMVYPTPPGTTNIHVWVNGTELEWSNWSYDTHHTAIGDWAMIYCVVSPVSDFFLLTIHYEHPLAVVNGSSLFLYDLNISPYLTPLSNSSIAYFTVRFESAVSDVRAYTTWTDSVWNQKDFALSSEGDVETVTIEMRSVLGEPLAGDLVVMFNDSSAQVPEEFPYWFVAVPVFVVAGLLAVIIYRKKSR